MELFIFSQVKSLFLFLICIMLRKHKFLKKAADVQLTVNVMIYCPPVAINVYLRKFFFSQLFMKMRKISF